MTAAQTLVPMTLFITMGLTLFGIFYIRSRENMALIERGFNPRQELPKMGRYAALKYGLLILGAGVGLISAYLLDAVLLGHKTFAEINGNETSIVETREPMIYIAMIAIGGGIGLIYSYYLERKHTKDIKE